MHKVLNFVIIWYVVPCFLNKNNLIIFISQHTYFQKTEIINLEKQVTHLVHDEIKYMKYFLIQILPMKCSKTHYIWNKIFSKGNIGFIKITFTSQLLQYIYNDMEAIMVMFYILWNNWNTLKLILWLKWIEMPENSRSMLFPNIRIEKPWIHYSHFAMCLQLIWGFHLGQEVTFRKRYHLNCITELSAIL